MKKNKVTIVLFFISFLIICIFLVLILKKLFFSQLVNLIFANDNSNYYQKSIAYYYQQKNYQVSNNVKPKHNDNVKNEKCNLSNSLKRAKDCTFLIFADKKQATSFAIADKLLLTNYHVIKDAEEIQFYFEGKPYPAKIKKVSKQYDIAILEIEKKVPSCELIKTETLNLAQDLYAIGWAYGGEGESMITKGIFSRLIMTKKNGNFIQSDALVASGNSGGPLVSDCGVVGMNTVKFFPSEDLSKLSQTFTLSLSSDFLIEKLDL